MSSIRGRGHGAGGRPGSSVPERRRPGDGLDKPPSAGPITGDSRRVTLHAPPDSDAVELNCGRGRNAGPGGWRSQRQWFFAGRIAGTAGTRVRAKVLGPWQNGLGEKYPAEAASPGGPRPNSFRRNPMRTRPFALSLLERVRRENAPPAEPRVRAGQLLAAHYRGTGAVRRRNRGLQDALGALARGGRAERVRTRGGVRPALRAGRRRFARAIRRPRWPL